jgi:hypothetical protein
MDGDIEITFDKNNTAEAIRAKRIIKDMIRRGYALLVKGDDGSYTRALDFNPEKGEYIIADLDTEGYENEQTEAKTAGKRGRKSIPMEKADVVAVARTAGG